MTLRPYVLTLLLWLACGVCAGQYLVPVRPNECPPGQVCPVDPGLQGWGPANPYQVQQQPQGQTYTAPLEPQQPWGDDRIVKLRNASDGGYDYLSGAVVSIQGDPSYVLLCGHSLQGKGDPVLVIFSDGTATDIGTVVGIGQGDVGLIKLRSPRAEYFNISDHEPQRGEKVYLAGFPNAEYLRTRETSYAIQNQYWFEVSGEGISGESGGTMVNQDGLIVGVISATDSGFRGGYTYGARLICIRRLLDSCFPNRPQTVVPPSGQYGQGMPELPREQQVETTPPQAATPPVKIDPPAQAAPAETGPPIVIKPVLPREPQAALPEETAPEQSPGWLPSLDTGSLGATAGKLAAGALGIGGPIGMGIVGAGWLIGRRLGNRLSGHISGGLAPPKEEPATAGGSFRLYERTEESAQEPIERDLSEGEQLLRLRRLDGRDPVQDAIVGGFIRDRLEAYSESKRDPAKANWSRELLWELDREFNKLAPTKTKVSI